MLPLPLIIAALVGWLEREQRDLIEFLREENRVLKTQLHGRRMRLSDNERRRLAVIGQRVLSENPAGIDSTRDPAAPARRVSRHLPVHLPG